jgi:hypothetical protein
MIAVQLILAAVIVAATVHLAVRMRRCWRKAGATLDRVLTDDQPVRTAPACIEDMPGHLERVQPLHDQAEDTFDDLAAQLMDDGMYEVCEQYGWLT